MKFTRNEWITFGILGSLLIVFFIGSIIVSPPPPIPEEKLEEILFMLFLGVVMGGVTLAMCCSGTGYLEYD